MTPLTIAFLTVLGLLGIALYGLLITRDLIKVVIALQLLVKAAVLALVLAGRAAGQLALSQSLAATVIVADTMVAVVGLALAIQIQRRFRSLDVSTISTLRG